MVLNKLKKLFKKCVIKSACVSKCCNLEEDEEDKVDKEDKVYIGENKHEKRAFSDSLTYNLNDLELLKDGK